MTPRPAGNLLTFLERIPDHRGRKGRRHPLSAMLAAVVCAVLSGFDSYAAIAQWIHAQEPEFWHQLGFTRRPPTWSGFRKMLMKLDPKRLEDALNAWIGEGLQVSTDDGELQAVSIDGKTLRGTKDRHRRAFQTIALLDQKTGCILSEHAVDPETNEPKAATEILRQMVLRGQVIVGDAAYCDRDICEAIVENKGDYLVVTKDNQPKLHKDARQAFVIPEGFSPLRSAGRA